MGVPGWSGYALARLWLCRPFKLTRLYWTGVDEWTWGTDSVCVALFALACCWPFYWLDLVFLAPHLMLNAALPWPDLTDDALEAYLQEHYTW